MLRVSVSHSLCSREVLAAFRGSSLIVRPSLLLSCHLVLSLETMSLDYLATWVLLRFSMLYFTVWLLVQWCLFSLSSTPRKSIHVGTYNIWTVLQATFTKDPVLYNLSVLGLAESRCTGSTGQIGQQAVHYLLQTSRWGSKVKFIQIYSKLFIPSRGNPLNDITVDSVFMKTSEKCTICNRVWRRVEKTFCKH